ERGVCRSPQSRRGSRFCLERPNAGFAQHSFPSLECMTEQFQLKKTNSETLGDIMMSKLTRRNFLGAAAVMAGGLTGLQNVVGAELHGADRSKSDPGPSNPALDVENPDLIWPPSTDSKILVQKFKYPFSFLKKR